MTVPLINFPASKIVDIILSYLQWVFANDEITPESYRWNESDRDSRIRISAPFVIDNEKPMSAPFIVVERGAFNFANSTIDNIKSSDANTFENMTYSDWMDGTVNIICGSGVASEASSIANFIAVMIQADRHGIIKNSLFIRNLNYIGIGPEIPVVKDSEVRRWEVTLSLRASLQLGWLKVTREPVTWESATFYGEKSPSETFSEEGVIVQGQSTLVDSTKSFGFLDTDDPQLLEKEFDNGWYYIRFSDNSYKQLYKIVEIVDSNTLRLQTHDENNDETPWISSESASNVEYNLIWNALHINMEIPTSGS